MLGLYVADQVKERQREATGEKIFYRKEMMCCRMHLIEKR